MTTAPTPGAATLPTLLERSVGIPEQAFGLTPLVPRDDTVEGGMRPGSLPKGADGAPAVGAVGVLVDDVLGFALIAAARRPSWSVSVEISLDFLEPLTASEGLHVTGHGRDIDGMAGFAHGDVRDDQGRVLIRARQHGRFLPRPDVEATRPEPRIEPSVNVLELLDAVTSVDDHVVRLTIDEPRPWLNSLNVVHGGVALCAAEAVATCATLDSAESMRTTSLSITFVRPMQGAGPVVFEARTLQRGRTLRVVDVIGSAGGRPCTYARVVRQTSLGVQ